MKWIYLLLSLLLGIICAGCACPPRGQLTIVAKSVQSTDVGDVEFEVQYEVE